jgi:uncharacterized membrane protein HdeD (DUF308 family)
LSDRPPNVDEIRREILAAIRSHWRFLLLEGGVIMILGLLALALPNVFTVATELFIGWIFLVAGILRTLVTLRSSRVPGFWLSLATGILAAVLGAVLILQPTQGVLTLTLVLLAFFILEGFASIVVSYQFRRLLPWGWPLTTGVLDLLLAYLIWRGWPSTAMWAIGLLVGINMLCIGLSLMMVALAARNVGEQ